MQNMVGMAHYKEVTVTVEHDPEWESNEYETWTATFEDVSGEVVQVYGWTAFDAFLSAVAVFDRTN